MSIGSSQGFTLLETLLALSLFVLTLAGTTAVQMQSLRDSEEASRRVRAVLIAADYFQRRAVTPQVESSQSQLESIEPGSPVRGCYAVGDCSPAEFSQALYLDWHWRVFGSVGDRGNGASGKPALPDAQLCVLRTKGSLSLTMAWAALSDVDYGAPASACTEAGPYPRRLVSLWTHSVGRL